MKVYIPRHLLLKIIYAFWSAVQIDQVNSDSCPESDATVKVVPGCPQTQEAWTEAAARKNCGGIPHSCASLVYHCVMNTWRNETVEVCAPTRVIVGKKCAEFNYLGSRVQRNGKTNCGHCPDVYYSDKSFQYPECYRTSRPVQSSTETEVTNSSLLFSDDGTTTNKNVPPTSSVTKEQSTNQNQHSDGKTKTKQDDSKTVGIILGIIAVAAVFTVLVVVVCCKKKKIRGKCFKFCKIGGQQEKTNLWTPAENKNRNEQQDRTLPNDWREEEQTMLDNSTEKERTMINYV